MEFTPLALARLVALAETPSPLSQRDGKLIPLVPRNERLSPETLAQHLETALSALGFTKQAVSSCQTISKKCLAAWARSVAYTSVGNPRQGLKDALFAITHAPQRPVTADLERDLDTAQRHSDNPKAAAETAHLVPALRCSWPLALTAAAQACAKLERFTDATAYALMALKLDSSDPCAQQLLATSQGLLPPTAQLMLTRQMQPSNQPHPRICTTSADRNTAVHTLPATTLDADSHVQGSEQDPMDSNRYAQQLHALLQWWQDKALDSLPEFLKPKEKYHHYYQWMRERLYTTLGLPGSQAPGTTPVDDQGLTQRTPLPQTVVKKILDMNADDLDLILKHPAAIAAQVVELLAVWRQHGDQGLIRHVIEPPAWEEVQLLTGPGCIGLPLGWNGGDSGDPLRLAVGSDGASLLVGEDGAGRDLVVSAGDAAMQARLSLLLQAVTDCEPAAAAGMVMQGQGQGSEVRLSITRRALLTAVLKG